LIGAFIFFLIGRWFARAISKGTKKLMTKLKVDNLAARLRSIDMLGRSRFEIVPSEVFAKIIYYFILFIVIWIAVDIVEIAALSLMLERLFEYLPTLFSALIVFVAGLFLADFLKKIITTTTKSLNLQVGPIIGNFVFYFLLINVAIISLAQAGIETDAIKDNISIILGGIVGAFAIGYGFASRSLLSSMLSSYYNKKKISKGDIISIDEVSGTVEEVDNMSITVIGKDDTKTIVPMNKLLTETYKVQKQKVVPMNPPTDPNP
ncbi:MAG: mechanosensitive ion channel domain-containing protein, partial [Bacteroidota bacterium]